VASMEETPTTIDTKRLAIEARQALREAYVPEIGHRHTSTEKALIKALAKLIHAVERSVDHSYKPFTFCPEAEAEEEKDLDRLYASITSRLDSNTSERKFVISFPPMELTVEEIWPDGNAPENPTPDDVVAAMKEVQYAHPARVASEWLLIDKLTVRYKLDVDGDDMEVEWDGA
jgi:hypothetical protein